MTAFVICIVVIFIVIVIYALGAPARVEKRKRDEILKQIKILQDRYSDYHVLFSPEHTGLVMDVIDVLSKHGINEFYHVTPVENLNNIFNLFGALLSYQELQKYNVPVKYISNEQSHINDKDKKIENLVKLSFRKIIPMIYSRVKQGEKLALLGIDINILYYSDEIYFCPTNATMQGAKYYRMSSNAKELSKMRFDVINANHGFARFTPEYAAMQAEVMVKDYIPKKYIRFIKVLDYNDL